MISHLKETNPAKRWLREQFQTSLPLANGQLIVTRFDVVSRGYFDADKVEKAYGKIILGDRVIEDNQLKAIYESIADVLNEQMDLAVAHVMAQTKMSFYVLDALEAKDWGKAQAGLKVLIEALGIDNDHADRIWGDWVNDAVQCIHTQDNTGSRLDDLM